jgi:methyl-accepting chemotaxis protein
MQLRFKLTITIVLIIISAVSAVSIVLFTKASKTQLQTTMVSMERLGGRISLDFQKRYGVYLQAAHNLAAVMGDYESLDPADRREWFVQMMRALIESNERILGIYACWLPNALDGMDGQYAGQRGNSASGQFIPAFSRASGTVEFGGHGRYQEAAASLSPRNLVQDPEPAVINGKSAQVFTIQVPIIQKNGGALVGAVGLRINTEYTQAIVRAIIADKSEYMDVAELAIYSNSGTIVAHIDADRIGKNVREAETVIYGPDTERVAAAIQKGEGLALDKYSKMLNTTLKILLSPLDIGDAEAPWAVMIAGAESVILRPIHNMKLFALLFCAASLVIAVLIVYGVSFSITKPIITVTETIKDISEGEGDLTRKISIRSKDEVEEMARYFNATLEKIKNLVANVRYRAVSLFDIGSDLAAHMIETAASINQITSNIQNVKGQVINQSASVTETNATMEQITLNINRLNEHIDLQTGSVAQCSSAIEEMLANIQSVTQTLIQNAENVTKLADASEVGRSGLEGVAADIQGIARESEGLLEINAVMESIASQTNLLSMNAAIEAAHAGEAGKGFAVVADEIRKLSESSSEQSKTISTVLKKIKESIDTISRSTNEVMNKFEAIDSGVRIVSEQEENIRSAMEEQNTGSRQILEAIGQLNQLTQRVKNGSEEMLEGSRQVIQEGQHLELVTQDISGSMNEMAGGANNINTAVNDVQNLTKQNRENINILVREVAKFKIE